MGSKKYTMEFKQEAVKLVTEQGYTQTEVGRRLGINAKNISRWMIDFSKVPGNKVKPKPSIMEDELKELRKEVKRLRMEREILKKAAAFFANEPH
jgi:transposase